MVLETDTSVEEKEAILQKYLDTISSIKSRYIWHVFYLFFYTFLGFSFLTTLLIEWKDFYVIFVCCLIADVTRVCFVSTSDIVERVILHRFRLGELNNWPYRLGPKGRRLVLISVIAYPVVIDLLFLAFPGITGEYLSLFRNGHLLMQKYVKGTHDIIPFLQEIHYEKYTELLTHIYLYWFFFATAVVFAFVLRFDWVISFLGAQVKNATANDTANKIFSRIYMIFMMFLAPSIIYAGLFCKVQFLNFFPLVLLAYASSFSLVFFFPCAIYFSLCLSCTVLLRFKNYPFIATKTAPSHSMEN